MNCLSRTFDEETLALDDRVTDGLVHRSISSLYYSYASCGASSFEGELPGIVGLFR